MTTSTLPLADLTGVLTLLSQVSSKGHQRGVLAIAAQPEWRDQDTLDTDYGTVRIRVATSVLAVRDALTERARYDWIVVLTNQVDLPTGVRDHLTVKSFSNLDPWPALRSRFHADAQEFDLLSLENAAARSALAGLPDQLEPAPSGVLTSDHLFRVMTGHAFGFVKADITPLNVLLWSTDAELTARFTRWRDNADDALVLEFYRWLERRLGAVGPLFATVWQTAGPHQLVPLGLVAALLDDAADSATAFPAPTDTVVRTRTLLEVMLGNQSVTERKLAPWGHAANLAVIDAVDVEVLNRAEALVTQLHATTFVGRSDVLPSALTARLTRLADVLTADSYDDIDMAAVENRWADVAAHRLSRPSHVEAPRDVRVGAASLRLLRWLRNTESTPTSTSEWLSLYRHDLSWVDAAVDEIFIGATDPRLAAAAHQIVMEARVRRAAHDRAFARHLPADGAQRSSGPGAPTYIEDLLDSVVKPLTVAADDNGKASPVLLVVADGMSGSAANELIADAVRRPLPQWSVCLPAESEPITVALSALPSVTEFSRCSLLSGKLAHGGQSEERTGFYDWLSSRGLRGTGQVLFHKADMDTATKANALATAVQSAIDDTSGRPVIACVLNDIDDALDRSDPIGTVWTVDRFKRLDPVLTAAAAVGRTVVLVSDHGHVVERREQPSVQRGTGVSARYRRADTSTTDDTADDEILVEGPRVLSRDHRAILAVDEQLRYTALKAGYHGGGALAELAIPVTILVNGAIPAHLNLSAASLTPGQPLGAPSWWDPAKTLLPQPTVSTAPAPKAKSNKSFTPRSRGSQPDGLFDLFDDEKSPTPDTAAQGGRDRVAELLDTDLFKGLYKQFGQRIKRDSIAALLHETINAGGALPLSRAANLLGVKAFRAGPAVQVLAQVLNTDGVIVLSVTGTELQLESETMFEQFGVN